MMHLPQEISSSAVSDSSPDLAIEKKLHAQGCEVVPIGRSGGMWGVRSEEFPGGRLLVCETREAFAMLVRPSQSQAACVVPLDAGSQVIHQGQSIPDGGAGFSMPGVGQVLHATAATRFAILWMPCSISKIDGGVFSMIFSAPQGEKLGHSIDALSGNDVGSFARLAERLSAMVKGRISGELGQDLEKKPRRLSNRMPLVVAVWEFIMRNPQEDLKLDHLMREAGKSSRTLEYAFTEIVGRTPIGFIKSVRLMKARRLILEGRVRSVKDAATASGLWHLGRFSIDYRLQFGEHPSQSLRFSKKNVSQFQQAGG